MTGTVLQFECAGPDQVLLTITEGDSFAISLQLTVAEAMELSRNASNVAHGARMKEIQRASKPKTAGT